MDKIDSQVMPAPPNMIASLRAGFDAIANKIIIIVIPIAIDLLLWLGPHLQIKTIINEFVDAMLSTAQQTITTADLITTGAELMRQVAAQFNLLSLLRTIPVGIPSLMASRLPGEVPGGAPGFIDITNPLLAAALAIALIVAGLVIGSFYYILIVQAVLQGKIELKKALADWVWTSLQVLSLAVAFLLIFVIISIPSSCAISAITLFGLPLGEFGLFIYFGIILWIAFPLLFSAHGIFVNHNNAVTSVQRSMLMTRMTLPTTSLFLLSFLVIGEGLNLLWQVPPETSWMTLIGVCGHAFISSALLASSFFYYRDANLWTQEMIKNIQLHRDAVIK